MATGRTHAGTSLTDYARQWPTPRASDAERGGRGELLHMVKTGTARESWPTPDARCWKSGKGRKDNGHSPQLEGAVGGQLNPVWVEWLMAFPLAWTDCERSATRKFRRWLRLHSRVF